MSQFKLTPEEDALVASALRAKAASYLSMFGSVDPEIEALLAKVESQLPAAPGISEPVEVVEVAEVAEEVTEETPSEE